MLYKFITALICVLSTLPAFGKSSETMKVIKVLKGDTVVAVNYKGQSKIIHIAGVDCPELNQDGGVEAKKELSSLTLNKKIFVTTTVDEETHALASLSPGLGGSGKDIGSELLQRGFCWYRNQESDQLRSPLKSSYSLLQNRARFKKLGIWKNGDIFFASSPESWRNLELYKLDQQRVNGADDPSLSGFNRPQTEKKPDDWRKSFKK